MPSGNTIGETISPNTKAIIMLDGRIAVSPRTEDPTGGVTRRAPNDSGFRGGHVMHANVYRQCPEFLLSSPVKFELPRDVLGKKRLGAISAARKLTALPSLSSSSRASQPSGPACQTSLQSITTCNDLQHGQEKGTAFVRYCTRL
jgi:hypothetical protein